MRPMLFRRRPQRTTSLPRLDRRTVLAAGGAALCLPLLDAMHRPAQAQEGKIRRLIFEFKPNGDQVDRRFDDLDESSFVLGEFLAPLEEYRKDLFFAHRVNKYFYRLPQAEQADAHQQGGASLAPWPSGEGDFAVGGEDRTVSYVLGPSADYALGSRVVDAFPEVPHRHLVYRVGDRHNDIWNLTSHGGPAGVKNQIAPETDPFSAYARLFGFLTDERSTAELEHQMAMKRSVLDLVGQRVSDLSAQLGAEDRQRLEIHSEAVRDLERTLVQSDRSAVCAPRELGETFDPYASDDHLLAAKAFFKIIALSFACDLSRVANFAWHGNTSQRIYRNLGLTTGHHDLSHQGTDESFVNIRAIHRHLWENTTQLYQELLATPEGEGTLWDSTAIVHWNELGQGDVHSSHDSLVVVAGGADGFFAKNRLIDYEAEVAFSDLLVGCFHYLGFGDVTQFGDPRLSNSAGPPPGLIA